MAQTPEGKVKAAIKKYLDSEGFWRAAAKRPDVVKGWYYMPVSNGMGIHGIPDFVCTYNGRMFCIEAKAPKGVLSEHQKMRHEEIRAAGGIVVVAYDVSDVEAALKWM